MCTEMMRLSWWGSCCAELKRGLCPCPGVRALSPGSRGGRSRAQRLHKRGVHLAGGFGRTDFSQNAISIFFTLSETRVAALIPKRDVDKVRTSFLSKCSSTVSCFQLLPVSAFVPPPRATNFAAVWPSFVCYINSSEVDSAR